MRCASRSTTWRNLTRRPLACLGLLASVFLPQGTIAGTSDPKTFWSLQPVTAPPVPPSENHLTPIDAFLARALQEHGLSPSPDADRQTLIRRVTFDLTGLPPTPQEIVAFLADQSPDAYEHVVDRLLASPRYGERWARHWLDVVRFAETNGFEMNQPRANAWPYRDYVIRAFNEDKPYDRFVLEQLAGDAVGEDDATGYLVAGPWDQVKSPDVVLTRQQRADELHDMVSTTGAAFLGLTVGCARCHDHKFDPITQTDYYRMTAIFAGVQHGERPRRLPPDKEIAARAAAGREELAAVEAELAEHEPTAQLGPLSAEAPRRQPVRISRNVDRFPPVEARFVRFTITATNNGSEPCIDELEVWSTGSERSNVALASAGGKATASGTLAGFAIHQLGHLIDGQYGNNHSWISNEPGRGWVQVELPHKVRIDRVVWGRDRERKFADRLPTAYRIEVAAGPDQWQVVATSDDRLPYRTTDEQDSGPDAIKPLIARRDALEKQLASLTAERMIYGGTFTQPSPTHRLQRGDPMHELEQVSPGGVAAVTPALDLPSDASEQQRRLALARWITDPRNPLAARVIANRLWHYHFGRGLVATPSDFGHMGFAPSHPQLLDWLASQLVANGWHLKPIQRRIVLSAAYRQSSAPAAEGMRLDAGNVFLWRYPPRRLEAEAIRDSILSITGKLDLTMGGPGYDAFEPNSNYVRIYVPKEEFGPPEWRRMVYQFRPRLQQDAIFGAFDCPDGGQTAPRRNVSTTPLQALNLLNSRFMIQQSEFFAQRLKRDAGDDPASQVRCAYRLAFGRQPTNAELAASVQFVRNQGLPLFCRALLNANELIFIS